MVDEKIQEAIQREVDAYPERWAHGVSCWVALNKTTGLAPTRAYSQGAPCHGGVTGYVKNHYIINAHHPQHHGRYPDFTLWVARESPFSHGVLNKDKEDEILNHAAVLDGDLIGGGGILWLCKAFRYTREDPYRIEHWRKLLNEGLNPLQAFIGCSILDQAGNPLGSRTHCSLFRYATPEAIHSFYKELLTPNAKRVGNDASRPDDWNFFNGDVWGAMGTVQVKKPDGWGGFVLVDQPANAKEFAEKLKKICEGDFNFG